MTKQEAYEKIFLPLVEDKSKFFLFYSMATGNGIGDFFIVGGLAVAVAGKFKNETFQFVQNNNKINLVESRREVVFVCTEKYKRLGAEFDGVTMLYLDPAVHLLIAKYISENNLFVGENYTWGWFYKKNSDGKLIRNWNLNFTDQFKNNLFDIPLDTPLQPPHIQPLSLEEKVNLHSKYFINSDSTVILCPYCRSSPPLPMNFWENLVTELYSLTPPPY